MPALRSVLATLLLLSACAAAPCGPANCATGCCAGGVCYEGTNVKGGAACSAGDECAVLDHACDTKTPCCATDPATKFPLRCGGYYCEEACGSYNDPCNATLCCARGFVCKNERCDSCIGKGVDCSYSFQRTRCCPGSQCNLKPGFTTVYECQ